MRTSLTPLGAALALLALAAGGAHAGPIHYAAFGSGMGNELGGPYVKTSQFFGGVEFGTTAGGSHFASAEIDVALLRSFFAEDGRNDFFDNTFQGDGYYTLSLELFDFADPRHPSGELTFTGVIGGTITATSADLTNTFTGDTTQSLWLNGNAYTVTVGPFVSPGAPARLEQWNGRIGAHVEVHPQEAPEPTTLALAGLGASLLGAAAWRWRRRPGAPACGPA